MNTSEVLRARALAELEALYPGASTFLESLDVKAVFTGLYLDEVLKYLDQPDVMAVLPPPVALPVVPAVVE